MSNIDPRAAEKIHPELMSGESIIWAGMPDPGIVFHSDDWQAIPFSLLWTAFWVFWEGSVLGYGGKSPSSGGNNLFMKLWGIPFLVIGNYMLWGRFLTDAWLKRRTYYAVTDRRLLILQEGWKRKTSTIFLREIPQIEREGKAAGTLWFGQKYPIIGARGTRKRSMSRFSLNDVPVFADIGDVESVHRLIIDLRDKVAAKSIKRGPITYNS